MRVLRDQFDRARERNERYSMRAFAKHTGLSIAGLSRTLRGDLTISSERAASMLERLELDGDERARLLTLMGRPPQPNRRALPAEMYEILTNWKLTAVWFCFDLDPAEREPARIAERLGITVQEVVDQIEKLLTMGLLSVTPAGVVKEDLAFSSGDGPPNSVVRQHHRRNLEMAAESIEDFSIDERDLRSLTVTGSRAQLEEVRAELKTCLDRISGILRSGRPRDEVFQVTMAVFPVRAASQKKDKTQ